MKKLHGFAARALEKRYGRGETGQNDVLGLYGYRPTGRTHEFDGPSNIVYS